MSLLHRSSRALLVVFLSLLVISVAQASWWIYEQLQHSRAVASQRLQELEADVQAARYLEQGGSPAQTIESLFPDLRSSPDGPWRPAPEAVLRIEGERDARVRRYLWEGGFFLLSLLGAIGLLWRTLQVESDLRRRQAEFLASVSHEFKSPLAALKLSLETLQLRADSPASRERLLARGLDDVSRLELVVSNLLDSAQLEDGRTRLAPGALSLEESARALLTQLQERAEALELDVEVDLQPGLVLRADPLALGTVLRNLLENALHSCAEARARGSLAAGAAAPILLRARGDGAFARIEVEDRGLGFPPASAEQLFSKFFQLERGERAGRRGTGLGLFLVRRFCELHGARVEAHSAGPGCGARFSLLWPLAKVEA